MRRSLLMLLLSGLWACSSPVTEGGSSTGAANGATGSTTGSGSTSGSSGSTTSSSSSGSTGGANYAGYVLLNAIAIAGLGGLTGGNLGNQHVVTATFGLADAGNALDPATCVNGILDNNGCCYRDTNGINLQGLDGGLGLDGGTGLPGTGSVVADAGAGAIGITADGIALGQLQPINGVYAPNATLTWNPGQLMGVTAAGDVIHAFNGSVTAPTSATVTSPSLGGLPPPSMSTSTALLVTWTGQGQKAVVLLTSQDLTKSLTCYGDNAGQRTISSTTLSTYFGPLAGQYGLLLVGVGNVSTATADNATITLAADTLTGGAVQFQ